MFCGQCGNNMSDSAKFCTKCGWKAPVNSSAEAPVSTTTEVKSEVKVQENQTTEKPKKKSKLWLWILLFVLVIGVGAAGTVWYLDIMESEEDEDEDEDEGKDDEDSDDEDDEDSESGYSEYVKKSKTTADASLIGDTMNAFEVLAADPAISWRTDEVVYVKFTTDGIVYGSDNEEVISNAKKIMGDDVAVQVWDGLEMWVKKDSQGRCLFSTSRDYDEMAEISPALANRFSMTSIEP